MPNTKFYYQVLVTVGTRNKSFDQLIYWIRNEKINYSTKEELNNFVKENLSELKKYRNIRELMVMEITKEYFIDLDNWYIKNSKPREYIVITEK